MYETILGFYKVFGYCYYYCFNSFIIYFNYYTSDYLPLTNSDSDSSDCKIKLSTSLKKSKSTMIKNKTKSRSKFDDDPTWTVQS